MMIMTAKAPFHADNIFIRSSLDSIVPYNAAPKQRVAVVHEAYKPNSISSSADIAHGLRISMDFTLLTPAAHPSDPCPWSFQDSSIRTALDLNTDILWINTPQSLTALSPPLPRSIRVIAQPPRLTDLSKPALLSFLRSRGFVTTLPSNSPSKSNASLIVLPASSREYHVLPPVVRGRVASYNEEHSDFAHLVQAAEAVARTLGASAPIRIDVRATTHSVEIVDIDLAPLAVGARTKSGVRESVPAMAAAARGYGWQDLVQMCLKQARTVEELMSGEWNWQRKA